jgi:hypothetical protein
VSFPPDVGARGAITGPGRSTARPRERPLRRSLASLGGPDGPDVTGSRAPRSRPWRRTEIGPLGPRTRLGPLSFALPRWQKWIMAKSTRLWADWRPIDTAPWEEDVTLLVTDGRGEPYPIPYPCKRTADSGWMNSSRGTPLAVTPLQWKPYVKKR